MSLLLDALKEAEKQRKSDEDTVQARPELNDNDEAELELELELDLESTTEPDGDLLNASPEPTESEGSLLGELAQVAAGNTPVVDTGTAESTQQVSAPAQQEDIPAPTPAVAKVKSESPHSANAVFRNRGRRKTKRYLLLGLLVACLSLLGVGAYLYFLTESFSPPAQSSLRTKNNRQPLASPAPVAQTPGLAGATNAQEKTDTEPAMASVVPEIRASENVEISQGKAMAVPVISRGAVTVEQTVEREVESANKPLVNTDAVKISSNAVSNKVANAAGFSSEEDFTGIKIRKRRIPAKREISLRRAQLTLASGDLSGAETHYGSVLKASPTNVAALLGMANVSTLKGQLVEARLFYQRVLEQSPQNVNARAGLLSLADSSSLNAGSALQQLVQESPEQAFLHASLGDYYLKRREWPAAQAAYFDAFSRDSGNADYAYNLAITLDQMAKPALALQFYQQALRLEKTRPAHFDNAVLMARIEQLQAAQR